MRRSRKLSWLVAVSMGTSYQALQGCDPAVRDTVLTGVEGAATGLAGTFIQAFFESLTADQTNNDGAAGNDAQGGGATI
ncbi:hypothetical protein RAS1_16570 [Phycisphaerae bacterium RAS1]|nr:hypothetical protein RAS1_16570 [Phycisphaerae bacterium RAS1]